MWHRDGSSSGPWREEVDAALAEMERLLLPNPDPNPNPNPNQVWHLDGHVYARPRASAMVLLRTPEP